MTDEFCKVTDDKDKSCQSNCEQKGSGSSNGNVRKRVVGYYEAWVNDRKCNGMVSHKDEKLFPHEKENCANI